MILLRSVNKWVRSVTVQSLIFLVLNRGEEGYKETWETWETWTRETGLTGPNPLLEVVAPQTRHTSSHYDIRMVSDIYVFASFQLLSFFHNP